VVPDARRASHFAAREVKAGDLRAPKLTAVGGASAPRRPAGLPGDPRVSVIIPARGAGELIAGVLDRLFEAVSLSCEVLVVTDSDRDPTLPAVLDYADRETRLCCLVNRYGTGSANAIRSGMQFARGGVIVVMMPDGRDDPRQIDDLVRLVERGCAVASASRYMHGGQLAGAPRMRGIVSRGACLTLRMFTGLGTSDATNSFKACSASFARRAGIDSRHGFDIGIELTAKARRLRLPIAEIPTIGVDHLAEVPGLAIVRWLPEYLRWYRFCFGPPLTLAQMRAKTAARPA
jgi:dolichol-phosphate mannosyltransferase